MTSKSWKNHPKKLHTYGSWELFFHGSPDCPKQPRTSFINYFIQPSLVGSLFSIKTHFLIWAWNVLSSMKLHDKLVNCMAFEIIYFIKSVYQFIFSIVSKHRSIVRFISSKALTNYQVRNSNYTPGWNVWGECLFYEVNAPLLQVCYKP